MSTELVLRLLKAAREAIDTPDKWTRGELARNAIGDSVQPYDAEATCFCAIGALGKSAKAFYAETGAVVMLHETEAIWALSKTLGINRVVADFNDDPNTTHADVLKLYDDTIQRLESAA